MALTLFFSLPLLVRFPIHKSIHAGPDRQRRACAVSAAFDPPRDWKSKPDAIPAAFQ
jgi:hypothetical protein